MGTRGVRGAALLAAATAMTLAAGCSGAAGAAGAGPPRVEKPDLTVAVVPSTDAAGFFIALYQGLFKAQGLHVTFVPATSSKTVIAGQVKGVYDITGGNYVSYIQAQQKGAANLDIFAEGSVMEPGTQGIYTLPNSPIRTLADLKGRTIAINAPNNILYLLAASILTEHGIPPEQVHFITDVPFPEMPAELKAGTIDAAALPEPFASIAEETDGAVPLVDLDQGATTGLPVSGFVTTKQWAAKYPHTLAAFYKAFEEGQQIADTERTEAESAMEDLPAPLGLSKQTASIMALNSYPVSTGPLGSVDKLRLERLVNAMRKFLAFGDFNIDSMLMNGG
jgi:NitT/TauT family transport system substrate-binding protein